MTSRPRRALMLGVGAAAAAAGLAAAIWRGRSAASPAASAASAGSGAPGASAEAEAVWALRLNRPEGGLLDLSTLRGRPLLVNFWATWCPPCIREMPEIDRFARQFAPNGWQVLGLAADQEKPVREFLGRNPVSYPIALSGFDGIGLSRQLGNDAGALPFTVAFDRHGRLAHRHLGETRFEVLAGWAREIAARP